MFPVTAHKRLGSALLFSSNILINIRFIIFSIKYLKYPRVILQRVYDDRHRLRADWRTSNILISNIGSTYKTTGRGVCIPHQKTRLGHARCAPFTSHERQDKFSHHVAAVVASQHGMMNDVLKPCHYDIW